MPPPSDKEIVQCSVILTFDSIVLMAVLKNGELWRKIWASEEKPGHEWVHIPGPYDTP